MIVNGCNATSYTSTISYRYNCTDWISIRVDGRKSAASNYACHCEHVRAWQSPAGMCESVPGTRRFPRSLALPRNDIGSFRISAQNVGNTERYSAKNPPVPKKRGIRMLQRAVLPQLDHTSFTRVTTSRICDSSPAGASRLSRTRSAGSLRRWRSRSRRPRWGPWRASAGSWRGCSSGPPCWQHGQPWERRRHRRSR